VATDLQPLELSGSDKPAKLRRAAPWTKERIIEAILTRVLIWIR
jgi:hypothetical protein